MIFFNTDLSERVQMPVIFIEPYEDSRRQQFRHQTVAEEA